MFAEPFSIIRHEIYFLFQKKKHPDSYLSRCSSLLLLFQFNFLFSVVDDHIRALHIPGLHLNITISHSEAADRMHRLH